MRRSLVRLSVATRAPSHIFAARATTIARAASPHRLFFSSKADSSKPNGSKADDVGGDADKQNYPIMLVRATKGTGGLFALLSIYFGWMAFLAMQDATNWGEEPTLADQGLVDPNNAIVQVLPDGRSLMSDGSIRRL